MRKKIISAMLAAIITMSAKAQSDSANIPEVVISATRLEDKTTDIGRSLSVIGPKELKHSLYTNVAELLSKQEGIYIVGAGQNPGNTQTMFTRGTSSNHTLIMIDGIRVTDPSAINNGIDLSELSLANVERIEIIRGSHSTMYGSSAIGGVVNIITRKNQMPGLNGSLEHKTGTFGKNAYLSQPNIFLNYSHKSGFYVNAAGIGLISKGLNATVDTIKDPNTFHTHDADNFYKTDLAAKTGFNNGKFDVFAAYKYTIQQNDIDKAAFRDDDNEYIKFRRDFFNYGASYKFSEKIHLQYVGGYSYMSRKLTDDSSKVNDAGDYDQNFSYNWYRGKIIQNELQMNIILKGVKSSVGAGKYDDRMTSQTFFYSPFYQASADLDTLNLKSSIRYLYLHTTLTGEMISEKLSKISLGLGTRFNSHSLFGSYMTYEINPSYKLNERSILYFSYSTGFNAPSLYQLYSPDTYYASNISRGNPNLKPETSRSIEAGLKQSVGKNISFTASLFRNYIYNNIEYVLLWDKNVGIDTLGNDFMRDDFRGDCYLNIGTLENQGFELSLDAKFLKKFRLTANYSYVDGKIRYKPSEIDQNHTAGNHVQLNSNGAFVSQNESESDGLIRRPRNTFNVGLLCKPLDKLSLRVDSRSVAFRSDIFYDPNIKPYGALGTVPVAAYTVVDFTVNYAFSKSLFAALRIENAFNTKYSEIKGFSTRPRGVFIKLAYTFSGIKF
jgi:vitamin B12 transporter